MIRLHNQTQTINELCSEVKSRMGVGMLDSSSKCQKELLLLLLLLCKSISVQRKRAKKKEKNGI